MLGTVARRLHRFARKGKDRMRILHQGRDVESAMQTCARRVGLRRRRYGLQRHCLVELLAVTAFRRWRAGMQKSSHGKTGPRRNGKPQYMTETVRSSPVATLGPRKRLRTLADKVRNLFPMTAQAEPGFARRRRRRWGPHPTRPAPRGLRPRPVVAPPERARPSEASGEGASAASGGGGWRAGPEAPVVGGGRGRGLGEAARSAGAGVGGVGAECAANPPRVPITDRVGGAGLCPAEPERGRVWVPSQGSHYDRLFQSTMASRTGSSRARSAAGNPRTNAMAGSSYPLVAGSGRILRNRSDGAQAKALARSVKRARLGTCWPRSIFPMVVV